MSMRELGYALVGCGRVSTAHIDALAQVEGARVVALADPDRARAERAAERVRERGGGEVIIYADHQAMLDDPTVEVVVVAAPTQMHPEIAIAAMEAGRHVYCEKAMAATLAGCRAMIAARDRTGMKLTIGQSTRFRAPFAMARRLIERGEVGEIVAIHGAFSGPANPPEMGATDSWRYRAESAGNGHVINFGCHYVDTARFLCGDEPAAVSAHIANRFSQGMIQEDQFVVVSPCTNGTLITIAMYCTPAQVPLAHEGFEVVGTDAFLGAYWRPDRVLLRRPGCDPAEMPIDQDLRGNQFVRLHRAFRRAIEDDVPVPVTAEDAMRNVEWGLAAYLSSERRCQVDLPLSAELSDYPGPQLPATIPPTRT